jgi:hypothetical protein
MSTLILLRHLTPETKVLIHQHAHQGVHQGAQKEIYKTPIYIDVSLEDAQDAHL